MPKELYVQEEPLECTEPADSAGSVFTTGELARMVDCTCRTVRFYEEAGLVAPTTRSEGGHRLYGEREARKLRLILDLREAGMSLREIRKVFELKCASTPQEATAEIEAVLEKCIGEMQRKIDALKRLRADLSSTLSALSACRSCTVPEFPRGCASCGLVPDDGQPRSVRLLWKP